MIRVPHAPATTLLDDLALRQMVQAQIAAYHQDRERTGLPVEGPSPERLLKWLTGLGPLEDHQ